MKRVRQARVPCAKASEDIPKLIESGIADPSAKIFRDGDFRLVPIAEGREGDAAELGYEITEGEAYTLDRRSPQERISEALDDLPDDVIAALPTKWEYVGDIVVVKLNDICVPYGKLIGETYANVLNAGTVCADMQGVSGEFRRPSMEILYGEDTESVRLENGIFYEFDVRKVMFASGNTEERHRMKNLDCRGETVVDMFAGIGYFTLPIAKFAGAERIYACEKNPDSYEYLLKNIKNNGVEDVVIPIQGDNRDIPGSGFADRVLMGYVQRTSDFIPKALDLVKKGGILHYHDTFRVGEQEAKIRSFFDPLCGESGYVVERIREVKSFAPSVSHYVADIRIL